MCGCLNSPNSVFGLICFEGFWFSASWHAHHIESVANIQVFEHTKVRQGAEGVESALQADQPLLLQPWPLRLSLDKGEKWPCQKRLAGPKKNTSCETTPSGGQEILGVCMCLLLPVESTFSKEC